MSFNALWGRSTGGTEKGYQSLGKSVEDVTLRFLGSSSAVCKHMLSTRRKNSSNYKVTPLKYYEE
jgi:hypothetical protein